MAYLISKILYVIFGLVCGLAAIVIGRRVVIGDERPFLGCFIGFVLIGLSIGTSLFLLFTDVDFTTGISTLALVAAIYALFYQGFN